MKDIIKKLRSSFYKYKIDGYLIPKNDEFFSEFANKDRLKKVTNFKGSAGYAIILKDKNYLFVDSRYTIQANIESGKKFKILDLEKIFGFREINNQIIGIDPALFTSNQIKKIFPKKNFKVLHENLVDKIVNFKKLKNNKFYSLDKKITGESQKSKINKIVNYLNEKDIDYIFISAPENVAWLLNIRGNDRQQVRYPIHT